ncbi:MAG TPA: HAMP domain-containing sensor histidine kinase [Candidatus Angelobacter sp.]|jgi:two-component system CheB/CheR fusion protein
MSARSIQISSEHSGENQQPENRPPPPENENGIVSSLAHEMNNPLEALHQLHYLIETEGTLREKGRQYLSLAREEVDRISQILHAAMELRDSGDPEDIDVPELLGSVLNFYRSRFAAQRISVHTRYGAAAHLSGYPHPLRQMCANLLLNAADAMPSGGKMYARIAPAHEWKGDHRNGLRLTFADTGSGIAAKTLARMWGPFFTTKGSAGNGIGLSLVKNTVQKHHGVLRVRSSTRFGHSGTVFSIFLPCA